MNDISMCKNSKCLKTNECYRYTAIPNDKYQHYQVFEDICDIQNKYIYFMSIEGKNDIRKRINYGN
jgi:hypothetical protein